ncbi:MAG: response regulator [Candidatus Omnitrophota bacterium]
MVTFNKNKLNATNKTENATIKTHTIMIVDDEPQQLSSLESLLCSDYYLITAKDGLEALKLIEQMENREKISLVISDQRMPGITGVELFERLLPLMPHCRRILITGFNSISEIKDNMEKAGIHEVIAKPFEPDSFMSRVRQAIETFEQRTPSTPG